MNNEKLSAFIVVEYDYFHGDYTIVVVAKNEDEAKTIAIENYGVLDIDVIEKVSIETEGYYDFDCLDRPKVTFKEVKRGE